MFFFVKNETINPSTEKSPESIGPLKRDTNLKRKERLLEHISDQDGDNKNGSVNKHDVNRGSANASSVDRQSEACGQKTRNGIFSLPD